MGNITRCSIIFMIYFCLPRFGAQAYDRVFETIEVSPQEHNRLFLGFENERTTSAAHLRVSQKVDLRPFMSPVKDQGIRGTCSAFAAVALAEAYRTERLSEQCLLAKFRFSKDSPDGGSPIANYIYNWTLGIFRPGLQYEADCPYDPIQAGPWRGEIQEGGLQWLGQSTFKGSFSDYDYFPLTANGDYPYDSKDFYTGLQMSYPWAPSRYPPLEQPNQPQIRFAELGLITENIAAANRLGYPNPINVVRNQLMMGNPVGAAVFVLQIKDWSNPNKLQWTSHVKSAIIDIVHVPEERDWCHENDKGFYECTAHAIVITGFDDSEGSFSFKNSWGTGWGDEGYGKMSFRYFYRFHVSGPKHSLVAATHR